MRTNKAVHLTNIYYLLLDRHDSCPQGSSQTSRGDRLIKKSLLSCVGTSIRGTYGNHGGTKEEVFRFVWVMDSILKEMTVAFGHIGIRIC